MEKMGKKNIDVFFFHILSMFFSAAETMAEKLIGTYAKNSYSSFFVFVEKTEIFFETRTMMMIIIY